MAINGGWILFALSLLTLNAAITGMIVYGSQRQYVIINGQKQLVSVGIPWWVWLLLGIGILLIIISIMIFIYQQRYSMIY